MVCTEQGPQPCGIGDSFLSYATYGKCRLVFGFGRPKNNDEYIASERRADEERRRRLLESLESVKRKETSTGEDVVKAEKGRRFNFSISPATKTKFKSVGSGVADFGKGLGKNAAENLSMPSGREVRRGARKAARGYQSFSNNFDFSFDPYGQTPTKKARRQQSDSYGSGGLDLAAYTNSFVPSTPRPARSSGKKKGRASNNDLYDPFAGLDFSSYSGGFGVPGESRPRKGKRKTRSKDPIGQYFY